MNKGPGRPIFPEAMRAEMLAALEYVDWVAVNHTPTAEPVLRAVKPDVYVKGSDYENPEEDISGKIGVERNVVEEHNGRIVFTKDITFSSSALINRYLNVYDPPLRDLLERLRGEDALPAMLALIEQVRDYRVVLVGDTIIDEYQYVRPMGKAAKENIIASLSTGSEIFAGGVIAAANHVASFCREVEVVTALGALDSHEELVRRSLMPNVKLTAVERPDGPTTRKCRFVDPSYTRKLFEVYFHNEAPFDAATEAKVASTVAAAAATADVVIASDFGHGLISPPDRIRAGRERAVPRGQCANQCRQPGLQPDHQVSAAALRLSRRAGGAARDDRQDSDIMEIAQHTLPARLDCRKIMITHGQHGCVAFDEEFGPALRIPALTSTIVDTVGAGDAFLAVTAPLVRAGGRIDHIGFIGNAAGAIKVGIVGHRRSVEKVPLLKFLTAVLK